MYMCMGKTLVQGRGFLQLHILHMVMINTANSEIFARILLSQIALKDIFAMRLEHLPSSVNDRVISPFK